jgi:tetratricopeptide (TPR) repeat protein
MDWGTLLRIISPGIGILKIFTIFLISIINVDSNAITKNIILPKNIPTAPTNLEKDITHTHVNNIYKFLLANLAIYRDEPSTAIDNLQQLLTTNDPQIAKILTEYAIELEDYKLSILAAKTWAELDPNNFKAQLIAVTMLLEDSPSLVEKFLKQAIKADPEQVDGQLSNLLPKLLDHHKQLILKTLKNLATKNPHDAITQLCLAQIAAQLDELHIANTAASLALKLKPDLTHAIFLQAKLIRYNYKSDDQALDYLKKQLTNFPENEELRLFYANALLDNNKIKEALAQLKNLLASNNQNYASEANLLTAEIYLQKENLNLAKAKLYLNKLINLNESFATGKVAFLLGQIAEKQNDNPTAINWYTSIIEDPYHVIGYLRAAALLANNQQLPQAIEILNQAQPSTVLEQKQLLLFKIELALASKDLQLAITNANSGLEMLPNDVDFLYAHSIIASLSNELIVAEKDLKKIISFQPDNHTALNALGYILATHTNRKKEALQYLQQALQLSPNDPIYMDSMGWLLYNMGKITDSLELLSKAYKIDDAPIIATHLGEVLWASGQQQQAEAIWKKAWQTDPNDEELLNTLKQYKINFSNMAH